MEKLTEFSLLAPAKCVADDVLLLLLLLEEVEVVDEEVVCSINEDNSSETELHLVS